MNIRSWIFGATIWLAAAVTAVAQPGPSPGPGPVPDPWIVNGATISYNNGGITLPSNVSGGTKGAGTINATNGYYVAGSKLLNIFAVTPSFTLPGGTLTLQPAAASQLGGVFSIGAVSHQWIQYLDTTGTFHQTQPAFTDISGTLGCAQMPALTGNVTNTNCAITVTSLGGTITGNPTFSGNIAVTGSFTNGNGTSVYSLAVNGGNSGTGAGANACFQNAGVANSCIGGASSILGGSYDATALWYSTGSYRLNNLTSCAFIQTNANGTLSCANPFISVAAFGATGTCNLGTGLPNETTQIQNAINAAQSNTNIGSANVLYFPAGNYCATNLTWTGVVKFQGAWGHSAHIVKISGGSNTYLLAPSQYATPGTSFTGNPVGIYDLAIDGNAIATYPLVMKGFDIEVRNNFIYNHAGTGANLLLTSSNIDGKPGGCCSNSPKTITAVTNANPGVFTVPSHGYTNGNYIYLTGMLGLTALNGNPYIVQAATTNTFTLINPYGAVIDTTSLGSYTASSGTSTNFTPGGAGSGNLIENNYFGYTLGTAHDQVDVVDPVLQMTDGKFINNQAEVCSNICFNTISGTQGGWLWQQNHMFLGGVLDALLRRTGSSSSVSLNYFEGAVTIVAGNPAFPNNTFGPMNSMNGNLTIQYEDTVNSYNLVSFNNNFNGSSSHIVNQGSIAGQQVISSDFFNTVTPMTATGAGVNLANGLVSTLGSAAGQPVWSFLNVYLSGIASGLGSIEAGGAFGAGKSMAFNVSATGGYEFAIGGADKWLMPSSGGMYSNGVTGGDKGAGTINAAGLYINGSAVAASSSLIVGTSTITSGTSTRILYDNAGVLGEYTLTGTGTVVAMQTSPSFVTPTLGVASATTVNKVTLTAPATGSTLTIVDGKTFTVNNTLSLSGVDGKTLNFQNSMTLAGTDAQTYTFPGASDTVAGLGTNQTFTNQNTHNVARTIASASGAALDDINVQAATSTLTGTTTVTKFNKVGIYRPTFTDASAVTITDAATLYVDNSPLAAGSVTQTNAWAIRVGAGNVSFSGSGNVLGTITSGTWNGSVIGGTYGGTGVNNGASTITLAGSFIVGTNGGTLAFGNASKTLTVNNTLSLSGVDGKTLNVQNTMTLAAGADAQTFTFPAASDTVAGLGATQTFSGSNIFTSSFTVGASTGSHGMTGRGGNTSTGDGFSLCGNPGASGSANWCLGNASAILGGAYDATPTWYTNGLGYRLSGLTSCSTVQTSSNGTLSCGLSISAGQYPGVSSNTSASAGNVGEYQSNTGTAVSVSSGAGTGTVIASKSLGAGEWACSGNVIYNPSGTLVATFQAAWTGTSSTLPTTPAGGYYYMQRTSGTGSLDIMPVVPEDYLLNTTTTINLYGAVAFTGAGATLTATGTLRCWRTH